MACHDDSTINIGIGIVLIMYYLTLTLCYFTLQLNTRYHGVELGQVSCSKQTCTCGI